MIGSTSSRLHRMSILAAAVLACSSFTYSTRAEDRVASDRAIGEKKTVDSADDARTAADRMDKKEAVREVDQPASDQKLDTAKVKAMIADKAAMNSIRDDIAKNDPETKEIKQMLTRHMVEREIMSDPAVRDALRDAPAPDAKVDAAKSADEAAKMRQAALNDHDQMRKMVKEMVVRRMMMRDHMDDRMGDHAADDMGDRMEKKASDAKEHVEEKMDAKD